MQHRYWPKKASAQVTAAETHLRTVNDFTMPLHKVWGSHWHSTSCSLIERKTLAGQQITSDCTSLLHMGTGRFWWGSIVLTSLWNKVRIRKKERTHKCKSLLSVKSHVSGKDPSSFSGQCNHSVGCAVFQAIVSGKTVAEIIEFGLISDLTVAPPLTSWCPWASSLTCLNLFFS